MNSTPVPTPPPPLVNNDLSRHRYLVLVRQLSFCESHGMSSTGCDIPNNGCDEGRSDQFTNGTSIAASGRAYLYLICPLVTAGRAQVDLYFRKDGVRRRV